MTTEQPAATVTTSSSAAGFPAGSPMRSRPSRSIRARVRALPGGRLAWRIAVTVVGIGVIACGIALLLLPGPGWLIIFAGLGVLATEYAWAARLLSWTRDQVRHWTEWLKRQPVWVRLLAGVVTLLAVVVVALAAWYLL